MGKLRLEMGKEGSQRKFQMGYTACEMLLERIEDPQGEMKSLLLDTELVIRKST